MTSTTSHAKTGSSNRPWVELEQPKPPRVDDEYRYYDHRPPRESERCAYWLRQIQRGWRPNRRLRTESRDAVAFWLGVYVWEYRHRILPALEQADSADAVERAFDGMRAILRPRRTAPGAIQMTPQLRDFLNVTTGRITEPPAVEVDVAGRTYPGAGLRWETTGHRTGPPDEPGWAVTHGWTVEFDTQAPPERSEDSVSVTIRCEGYTLTGRCTMRRSVTMPPGWYRVTLRGVDQLEVVPGQMEVVDGG